ncbi:ABC transporter permease [Blautia sp.]|uniref:ABC transporter permease n=1 Tax=Blautia sp. TaxID=1955243 RepID=UPI003AF793D7
MSEHSPAQKQYLLRVKREKNLIHVSRILLFLGFLILWEISARFGWIDSFIFSSPSEIWITFLKMLKDQSLFTHIGITLAETLVSFVFTVLLGIGTAVLLWTCPRLSHVLEPYLVVLNSLPKSALAPLLIVWLGANIRTIIVAGISVAIFGSIINLYTGFREVDPEKQKLIQTLGGSKKDELTKIVLPSSVPLILSVMKVNIGLCLVGVIIGEFIGARQGLGYLIIYGSQTFNCAGIRIRIDIVILIFCLFSGYSRISQQPLPPAPLKRIRPSFFNTFNL